MSRSINARLYKPVRYSLLSVLRGCKGIGNFFGRPMFSYS